MRSALLRALAVAVIAVSGCSYTTTVRSEAAGELWIGDDEAGRVGPGGGKVSVPRSYQAPPWTLYVDEDDVPEASGVLARTELEALPTAGLCALSAVTAPSSMCAGFCLANPTAFVVLLAPLNDLFLLSGVNAARTSLDNPTWPTVPVMMGCAVCGLLPLALLPLALRVPDEVDLTAAPPSALPSPVTGAAVSY